MTASIKEKIKNAGKAVGIFLILTGPFFAQAQDTVNQGLNSSGLNQLFGNRGVAGSDDIFELISNIIRLLLLLAGAIAVVFVIIGGYFYVTSAGNEEQAEKGKKTLINAIIGIVVIILSYAIISVISNTVSSCSGWFC